MLGRYLFGDTLLRWADIYWGTHCNCGHIFIGGHIVTVSRCLMWTHCYGGQIFIGRHIVMMGRLLLGSHCYGR